MSTIVQQSHYRSGEVRERVTLRNGRRHGIARAWHRNGRLASEERYVNGLLHGVCRQWNGSGRLLGKFQMVHGTGKQRSWHDNGRLQTEFSTLRGEFCGRCRSWLSDGTLFAEQVYLQGRLITADEYRAEAAKNPKLPRLARATGKPVKKEVSEKYIHRVFVSCLLAKPNRFEARAWLQRKRGTSSARFLGRFKHERDAIKFVTALYEAGATKVIAPEVHTDKAGGQFADCLLVRLPKGKSVRSGIRKRCAILRKCRLGAVQPDTDIGETHLFLSLA